MEGTTEHLLINGQEYAPEEASQLIELGNKYRETERSLNTSLDKLMPEYTRATQRVSQYEKELTESRRKLEEYETKSREVPEDKQKIIAAAREAGLADQGWLKEQGYLTRSELDNYYTEKETQRQQVENVIKNADSLEREIDGSDGRAPFNKKAVLAYASAYNTPDLKQAYEEMNEAVNAKWKEAQIEKSQRPGLTTLKPGGKKSPPEVKLETPEQFNQAWDEMFGGAQ